MKTIEDLAVKLLESSFFMGEAVELLEKGMITGALLRTEGNQCEAEQVAGDSSQHFAAKDDRVQDRRPPPQAGPEAHGEGGRC